MKKILILFYLVLFSLLIESRNLYAMDEERVQQYRSIKINTSNQRKKIEFERLFGESVVIETQDLKEPDADSETVVIYKASQFEGVFVDDTSLEIEGEDVGVNVKWLIDSLDFHIGKNATFISLLGIRLKHKVFLYRGEVQGQIVASRGIREGFLSYFQPKGSDKTLGECLALENCVPDGYNARYYAVQAYKEGRIYQDKMYDPIEVWAGKFQNE